MLVHPSCEPGLVPSGATASTAQFGSGWDDQALIAIYRVYFGPLARQAGMLAGDAAAEDIVQDCFLAMHAAWGRLRDPGNALGYLRRSVANQARSVLRHQAVTGRHLAAAAEVPSAEDSALVRLERSAVTAALAQLSPRQRQAVLLRYYADLPEAQTAAAMGVSNGAVKQHLSRAITRLRAAFEAGAAVPDIPRAGSPRACPAGPSPGT